MYSTFLKRLCRRRHPIPVNSCRGLLCYLRIEPQNYSSPVSVWCIDFMRCWVSADNYLWQPDKQRFTNAFFFFTSNPIPGSFSLLLGRRVMRPLAHLINLSIDSKFLRHESDHQVVLVSGKTAKDFHVPASWMWSTAAFSLIISS